MRLAGREHETRRIDSLLETGRAGKSEALMVRGEPGIGKTTLLRYATEHAHDMIVLQAQGLEVESELAFCALADVFRPVIERLDAIPEPQAAALAGALGLGPPVPGDRFLVCASTLSLLAAAAEHEPVLAVVDDVQWVDAASREALFFAARRLESEGVAMLITGRDWDSALDSSGLDELLLAGLERDAAAALVEDRLGRSIRSHELDQLMEATAGNPLALCELTSILDDTSVHGVEPARGGRRAVTAVERAFLQRIGGLPRATRDGLVVVAADSGMRRTILGACTLLGLPDGCLQAAERAGVIRVGGDRITFTHPLLRAAVYHAAPEVTRNHVHRALADVLGEASQPEGRPLGPSPAERQAWQLGAATREPDEPVASALEAAASLARSRSGYAASASALERAAALTPRAEDRIRRWVHAARDWHFAGHGESAVALLDEAVIATRDDRQRAEIHQLRAQVKMWQGEWASASDVLAREAQKVAADDAARAALMLVDAAVAACTIGELDRGRDLGAEARRLGRRTGGIPEIAGDVVYGSTLVFRGETALGAPLILRHVTLAEKTDTPPVILMLLPHVLICLEEYEQARSLLNRLVGLARGLGAPSLLAPVLPLRAELAYRTGEWFAGHADAVEGVQLARETNQNLAASLVHLAQIEAVRGLVHECRQHAGEALELATRHGIKGLTFLTHALVGKLELGLGRVDAAICELELATEMVRLHGTRAPNLAQEAPDLIEAYSRSGRRAEAAEALETLEEQAEATQCAWALAAAARCRGLLANSSLFESEFERALTWHERTPTPFEQARTELCFGERLRRTRRGADARTHLRSALQTFDRLGAKPWADRARSELAATGETARPKPEDDLSELTPQELQLSLIVGRGATNKEASAALFISPKTVEAHLHRIYVKLGIRSRTDLARLLARAQLLD